MACKKYTGLLVVTSNTEKRLVQLRCKQWDCPHCSKINAGQWREHLMHAVNAMPESYNHYFVTITARKHDDTTLSQLQESWRKITEFYRRICRNMGGLNFEYIRVFEKHKSGAYHMHAYILSELPLPTNRGYFLRWSMKNPRKTNYALRVSDKEKRIRRKVFHQYRWRDVAVDSNAGYIVDCQNVRHDSDNRAVGYILKYLGKQQGTPLPKHTRRIMTSRLIGSPQFESENTSELRMNYNNGDLKNSSVPVFFRGQILEHREELEDSYPCVIWSETGYMLHGVFADEFDTEQ